MSSARQSIGYCPQFEALSEGLTGRQHLILFSKLRGIPSHQLNDVVNDALNMLELVPHADKPVSAYSGGNCRRLSTAIALLANPPVILLVCPFKFLILVKIILFLHLSHFFSPFPTPYCIKIIYYIILFYNVIYCIEILFIFIVSLFM